MTKSDKMPGQNKKASPKDQNLPSDTDRLSGLIDHMQAGYFFIDVEGRFQRVNRAWLAMHGYESPGDVIGQPFSLTQVDADLDAARRAVADMLSGKAMPAGEFTRRLKDGSIGYHTFSAHPVIKNGRVIGLEGFLIDTTSQHQLTEELRRERDRLQGYLDTVETGEAKYRNLFNNAVVGMYRSTIDGSAILEINQALCDIFERTREEMLSGPAGIHWASQAARQDMILQLQKSGSLTNYEADFIAKSGKIKKCLISVKLYPDDGYLEGTTIDITARRTAEENYRRLFNEMLDGFALHEIICDTAGHPVDYRYIAANPAFERMTGLKVSDILGRCVTEVLPGIEPYWIEKYGQVALTRKPVFFENYADALKKHFEVTAFSPAPGQFACIFADITERKLAQDTLRDNERYLRTILQTAAEGFLVVDLSGRILEANDAYCSMSGYLRDELTQLDLGDIDVGETADARKARSNRVRALGSELFETCHRRKDGTPVPVEVSVTFVDVLGGQYVAFCRDLTDRKKTEEKIRESEAQYRTLVESSPDIIMRFDRDGRHLFASENVRRATNLPASAFIGKTHRDMGFPETLCTYWEKTIRQVFENGAPYETEFTFEGPEGQMVFNWRLIPEIDTLGQVRSVLSISRDITAHRKIEQDYRTLFNEMLNGFAVGEIIYDGQGRLASYRLLAINPAFERLTGLRAEDVVGKNILNVMPILDAAWIEICGKVAVTGEPAHFEKEAAEIGKIFEVNAFRPAPNQFACIIQDITERKHAEDKLKDQMEFVSTLLDTIPSPVFYKDISGKYRGCNRAFEEFLGTSKDNIIGKSVHDLNPADIAEKYEAADNELFDRGGRQTYEWKVKAADGTVRDVIFNKAVIRDSSGKITGLVGVFLDISERILAEKKTKAIKSFYEKILDGIMDGVWVSRADDVIFYANKEMGNIAGIDPKLIEGACVLTDFSEETLHHFRPLYLRAKESLSPLYYDTIPVTTPAGKQNYQSGWLIPLVVNDKYDGMICTVSDVTDRKRAEAELAVWMRRYEMIVAASGQVAYEYIVLTGQITWGASIERVLGYSRPEMNGGFIQWQNLLHPDDIDATMNTLMAAETACSYWDAQYRMQHKRGDYVWIRDRGFFIPDVEGKAYCQLGMLEDITEKKKAEKALLESEEKFSRVFEKAPLLMTVVSLDNDVILDVNEAFTKVSGFSRDEAIGKTAIELGWITPEERAGIIPELRRKNSIEGTELNVAAKDGTKMTILLHAQIIQIGGQRRILTLAQDISERKKAEKALRDSEEKFRKAFYTSPDAVNLNRVEDGMYNSINPGFTRILGYTEEEIIGKTSVELNIWNNLEDRQKLVAGLKKDGIVLNLEAEFRSRDGRIVPGLMSASLIELDGVVYILSITRDMTERKNVETEKAKLEEQLRQSQKLEAIGRLAGGVAHDFNNMLAVIIGHTELALDHIDPSAPFYADMQAIRKATEHSAGLVRQLLAFARKQTIAPKVIHLNEAVQNMFNILKRLIGEDIDLALKPQADLWPIRIDPGQVDQVLANLCINARDAIAGQGKIIISTQNITCDEIYRACHEGVSPGDYVLLAVSDSGCGMDAAMLGKIFDPFFTTKEVGKGSGLGLSTVYGIVSQNSGSIQVESKPGQGTTFSIYLPRYCGDPEKSLPASDAAQTQTGQETILLVEDELSLLKMTEAMLRRLGYLVLSAVSPEKAVQLAKEHPGDIHLLLTDVIMPAMNGRELAEKLQAIRPGLRCLFMSGYTADVIAKKGILDEGVLFLQKPFQKNSLAAKVREALDQP